MEERTPKIVAGRYALFFEIASGGMAQVHLARQLGAGGFARTVAVKTLHAGFSQEPEVVSMFLDEARLASRIAHPNVVSTLDVVAENGELYLVMEYVDGESMVRLLSALAKRGQKLPLAMATGLVAQILRGLHAAHEARSETGEPLGIVHRDVSPHNVMIGVDGIAKVVDFGVAKAAHRAQTTQAGQLKGKLSYMPPEQLEGQAVDRRADVYAAGVVLWEALAGHKLFSADNEGATVALVMRGATRPPSAQRREVPPALDAVVMKALSRSPAARFGSALEMATALEATLPSARPADIAALLRDACGDSLAARAQRVANAERSTGGSRSIAPGDAGRVSGSFGAGAASVSTTRSRSRRGLGLVLGGLALAGLGAFGFVSMYSGAGRDSRVELASRSIASGPVAVAPEPKAAASAATNPCPPGMAAIPGGRFFMGSDDDRPDEKPAHNVTLRPFCIDLTEVTTAAYRACSDKGECKRAPTTNRWDGISAKENAAFDPLCNAGAPGRDRHPVNCVDWSSADRYCKAQGKRLPTEAEWEFAARGSDGRRYPWGDAPPSPKLLNACGPECSSVLASKGFATEVMFAGDDGWPATAPVGSFPDGASRWGPVDMVGNVWEWVSDFYGPYAPGDVADPVGPTSGKDRVVRGGAWNGVDADWVRPAYRFHDAEATRSHGIGFRCAAPL